MFSTPTRLLSLIASKPGMSGRWIAENYGRWVGEPSTHILTAALKRAGLIRGVRDKNARRTLWYPTDKGAKMFGQKNPMGLRIVDEEVQP
jgi:DNA-binding MarR family transcriptional regulator